MTLRNSQKLKLLARYNYECLYCSTELDLSIVTVEHLIARSLCGTEHVNNIAPACSKCNNKRGNLDLVTFIGQHADANTIKAKIEYTQSLMYSRNDNLLNIIRNNIVMPQPRPHYRFWKRMGFRTLEN